MPEQHPVPTVTILVDGQPRELAGRAAVMAMLLLAQADEVNAALFGSLTLDFTETHVQPKLTKALPRCAV